MSTIRRRVGAVLTAIVLGLSTALPGTVAALAAPPPDASASTPATATPGTDVTAPPSPETSPTTSPSAAPTVAARAPAAAPATESTAPQLAASTTEPSATVTAAALSEGELAIQVKAAASVSVVGTPVTAIYCGLVDGGCYQHFQYGSIYWSPSTGAHYTTGGIRAKWSWMGWEKGFLGYPTVDEGCGLAQGGCYQHFQHGSIYWSSSTGARFVTG
ncbi:LGFP repeat-containing protein, partial [Raineyella antarctica]|uniref:LGFP repeat-containing protein n=1 Tax=Raineyella antarctica TaxID=1577474 RepID=UPI003CCBA717